MDAGDAAVGHERGFEAVGREGREALASDGKIGGSRRDDEDLAFAPRCWAPTDDDRLTGLRRLRKGRAAWAAVECRGDLGRIGPCEQDGSGAVIEQLRDDRSALLGCLAGTVDSLRKALPYGAIVVDASKAQVGEGYAAEAGDGLVGGHGARTDAVEQECEIVVVHRHHYPASMTVDVGTPRRIAYLGPPGTFTEQALVSEADLADQELIAVTTIAEAFAAVVQGEVDAAFVPIENSIEGPVNATIDQLAFSDDLLVQREVVLDVHLDLMALPGTAPGSVGRVLSFPHASAQCRDYLRSNLPTAEVGATNSTADAARLVAEGQLEGVAAIAPPLAAKLYGLEVLAHAIEDHDANQTRFVLVAPHAVPAPTGHDRTTLVCFQHADRPGSLYGILGQFAARSLNLTFIESRPTKLALGQYCFVVTVEGHVTDEVLGDCLKELRTDLEDVKFLGSYPVPGAAASERRAVLDADRRSAQSWLSELRSRVGGGA
ncbi:MAG: prephenate dehydratase [Acidimicrobiaceae bacterium]|nr:prephenate dehydratase [Acidimicrobiaceae bacterium]